MIDVERYLDSANKGLWHTMTNSFNLSIEYCSKDCYANYLLGSDCILYVPKNRIPDSASFTHELLHLYLAYKDIHIGGAVKCMLKDTFPLYLIFNDNLFDHISNTLEHIKMFPLYQKMGYSNESFLLDYYEKKLTESEVDGLNHFYKKGILCPKYNRWAINYYIGKFFAVKADINTNNHYDRLLKDIDRLDHKLFSVLDNFWNSWLDYDIEKKREASDNDYHSLVEVLANDLVEWSNHKNIV